ncbi:hypothetical protein RABR111495_25245 [Rahnella bruchi]
MHAVTQRGRGITPDALTVRRRVTHQLTVIVDIDAGAGVGAAGQLRGVVVGHISVMEKTGDAVVAGNAVNHVVKCDAGR